MITTPENVKYDYKTQNDRDVVFDQIQKISEMGLRCTLEVNFDGSGGMTAKITKLSSEDTDRLLNG